MTKPRKPRRPIGLHIGRVDTLGIHALQAMRTLLILSRGEVETHLTTVSLTDARRLHAWLGRYIAWRESRAD